MPFLPPQASVMDSTRPCRHHRVWFVCCDCEKVNFMTAQKKICDKTGKSKYHYVATTEGKRLRVDPAVKFLDKTIIEHHRKCTWHRAPIIAEEIGSKGDASSRSVSSQCERSHKTSSSGPQKEQRDAMEVEEQGVNALRRSSSARGVEPISRTADADIAHCRAAGIPYPNRYSSVPEKGNKWEQAKIQALCLLPQIQAVLQLADIPGPQPMHAVSEARPNAFKRRHTV